MKKKKTLKKRKSTQLPYGEDDCPICRKMREAEAKGRDATYEELEEGFAEAKAMGYQVGTGEDLDLEDDMEPS